MNTNRTARIASIIEKRRPFAQQIEGAEANLKSLASALRNLEDKRNQLLTQVDDPNVIGQLKEIDFSTIQLSIAAELEALGKLRVRFSRDTLNIGVVGRARQGKSRLLQSLTGLTAAEIPDGDRQHCTGVRSTIHHNPSVETHGEVWFYSERSFLDEVLSPYYEKLRLGAKPMTIQDFASQPLPPLPNDLRGFAEYGAMYEHLSGYHANLEKYCHLLREPSPRRIGRDEIRQYVAQDNLAGERIYFNYLAVREVKIVCNFPNAEVGQIALVDMPGLGDTGIGDAERLVKTLGQDVDAVLFVRMPSAKGDYWADVDVRLYDTASTALVDLPLNQWSFMILNQTGADSKNGDNSKNCQDLAGDIAKKHINVSEWAIANCANPEEANKVLDRVLDYLAANITALDKQYASSCQERLSQLQSAVKAELDKARTSLGKEAQQSKDAQLFVPLFNKLWKNLRNGLQELLKELRKQRDEVDTNFKEKVDEAIQNCREDTGIPSIEEIEIQANSTGGYPNAYYQYLPEVRAHLSHKFLSLDEGLKLSLEQVKSQVTEVLVNQGRLGGLTEALGSNFLREMVKLLPDQLIPGEQSKLKFGFQLLAEFELSYRGFVQHRIRQHLDGLTPNESATLQLSTSPSAQQVFLNLKTAHAEAVYQCENALENLLCEPSQAAFAIVEEFLDRILRAEDVDSEWRIFLDDVRSEVWPDEFKQLNERTRMRREWLDAVDRAAEINESNSMQFLN
ncbi:hypothetical protein H6F98_03970 [Microcoleus sp. FACHB-SPT15]|uniref:hypothetical protein n=1 Tax=Microcoleus sp. FACHB-SPT15 TaxID=2692830 RepID=UPI00177F25E7|nr:hypothetical protein [Microcoleus sp. FACHB-SPT15]MBD1804632.1 hypothetical protein [Microcoleus sp. FACHB-SPT15]